MTLAELKAYIATQLVAPVTLAQKVINCFYAVVDFITQSDNSGIPAWVSTLTFNTDGTGDGAFCTYVDVAGTLRFWKTKTDTNINHAPPTSVSVDEDTYWIEVSPANGSSIKEWAPGVFGEGLIIVFYDAAGDGTDPALYKLNEAVRPFSSTNIVTEIAANQWKKMQRDGSGLETFTTGNLSPLFAAALGADPLLNPALTFTLTVQAKNKVFAGPVTGADAAPTFRALTDSDGVVIKEDATDVLNLLFKAGTTAKAMMKFAAGALLTSPTTGAWEFDGTHLYFTIGGVRKQLDAQAIAAADVENGLTSTDKIRLGGALTANTTLSGSFKLLMSMNEVLVQKNFGRHASAPSFEEGVGISYIGVATTPPTTPPTTGVFKWVEQVGDQHLEHIMDTHGNITIR